MRLNHMAYYVRTKQPIQMKIIQSRPSVIKLAGKKWLVHILSNDYADVAWFSYAAELLATRF